MPMRRGKKTVAKPTPDTPDTEPAVVTIPTPKSAGKRKMVVVEEDDEQPATAPRAALVGTSASHANIDAPSELESTTATTKAGALPQEKKKKKKKRSLSDLQGFEELLGGGSKGSGDDRNKSHRREKPIEAVLKLATHMKGEKKGQPSGRVFYAINPAFDDNARLKEVVQKVVHQRARFFDAWSKWAVPVPSAEIALKLHAAIRAEKKLRETARKLNVSLDVSIFDHPKVEKPSFTLAESETEFETRADGVLPRSILILGNTYPFKEFFKEKFEKIRYLDLIFNGGTEVKSGWVLPVSEQTETTGTLAAFLRGLGCIVTEENLDEGEDDSDEDAERDDTAFVDDEAEEGEEDDSDESDDDDK